MISVEDRLKILLDADPGSWIAFSADETVVVGRGKTCEDAVKMAELAGENDPVLIKIPEDWSPQVYGAHPL